jgi:hypothetical protein
MARAAASGLNTLLALNRLGRGNAALFLLLSYGAIGTGISLVTHVVLAQTAALWYNGLNDLFDLELDRSAYARSPYRKVLLNGAMGAPALWRWLIGLLVASAALLVLDVRASLWSLALFAAGILSSVVYNMKSKYLARPSVARCIVLDAVVGGPFYFYYAGLAAAAETVPDATVVAATIGSLLLCGLFGNFIFASKDLSTDAKKTTTLPMIFGSAVAEDGTVRHSRTSRTYMWFLCALLATMLVYTASRGHWFALAFAARFVAAVRQLSSGRARERDHKKTFIYLSNWQMAFFLSMYIRVLNPMAVAQLVTLGGLTILANVAYYHDEAANRMVMLRFGRAIET